MTVPARVYDLVERFDRNREAYLSNYNETQVRGDFIDPLLEELGWDVHNRQGHLEAYRQVIEEDKIKVGGGTKAPDYGFYVGDARKFFLEAKKPSVDIAGDVAPAVQLRRYAWSAQLPLSILSDFEEFAFYDCRFEPQKTDKPSTARLEHITYDKYADRWEQIYSVFSYEAVRDGSLDKFAETAERKRGTQTVDEAFLKEIEGWREALARDVASHNSLSHRQLNYAVQMIIDRIIFLRMAEDRGIEHYGRLLSTTDGAYVYDQLCNLFREADDRYNSGLFHFHRENGRSENLDRFTLGLKIDDALLRRNIGGLYYPESPYEFGVLPEDVLGQVYERFLGKVIRLENGGHRAMVEEKPEVRKAGGVYYTPTYIVDYIVERTVGKLLEKKTPEQALKLKIVDPACGSGSFLLGAYKYLLDWYCNHYLNSGLKKHLKKLYQGAGGRWMLTIDEKKRILLNNIYGVDVDPQAVEVTKLSLLLKVLEAESEQTLEAQLRMFHERALPDLDDNIKSGNSLIGPDFYEDEQMVLLDEEEHYRINVFDWESAFLQVFSNDAPGFDAVIGNPPYLRIQGLQEHYGPQIKYFLTHYQSAVKRFDLYLLFTEKGFSLLKRDGRLGFICPHKFLNSDFGSGLREFLIQTRAFESFVSLGNNLIFSQASTYTGILLLKKTKDRFFSYYEFPPTPISELPARLATLKDEDFAIYDLASLTPKPWVLASASTQNLIDKLREQPTTIEDVFDRVFQGVVTGVDDIYFLVRAAHGGETTVDGEEIVTAYSPREGNNIRIEKAILKPMLKGEDGSRYTDSTFKHYYIYPYKLIGDKTVILQEEELSDNYPLAYEYLRRYKDELRNLRIKYKTNPKYWYSCHRARSITAFESERIITPEISLGYNMTIGTAGIYHNTKVYSFIQAHSQQESRNYWLGILNSKVLWWYLSNTGYVLRGGYFVFKTNYLRPFPIPT